jgi:hypothetical protein
MNTKYLIPILLLVAFVTGAHTMKPAITTVTAEVTEKPIYQLFPTANIWTFIKLDTRNGKMWQVHFTVNSDEIRRQLNINSVSLVELEEQMAGRFTLLQTQNTYNFLLLDQVNGKVTQVQWSMEPMNRGIIGEIEPLD